MTDKKIVTGVIGAGVFGAHHAAKIAASDRARLAGVYDVDAPRADAIARENDAPAASSLDALIDISDALVVASPAVAHAPALERALAAGKHVYVEKPVACDAATARRLAAFAEERGLVLGVGHQERFVFAALGALDPAASPTCVEAVRKGPRTGRGEDVSVVLDLMVHDLDLVAAAFGGAALLDVTPEGAGDFDEARAALRFAGSKRAHIFASRRAETRERLTRIHYADGIVEIDFLARSVRSTRPGFSHGRFETADPRLSDPLGFGLEAFFGRIRGEAGPRPVSGREGAQAVALAEAVETACAGVRRTA